MVTIDWDSVRKTILFDIQHHGTRTQGEEYRQEQVAAKITQTLIDLLNVLQHANEAEHVETTIKIGT